MQGLEESKNNKTETELFNFHKPILCSIFSAPGMKRSQLQPLETHTNSLML